MPHPSSPSDETSPSSLPQSPEVEPAQPASDSPQSDSPQAEPIETPAAALSPRFGWTLILLALLAVAGLSVALVVAWLGHQQAQHSDLRLAQLEQQHQLATEQSAHQLAQVHRALEAEQATQQAELAAIQRAQQQALNELNAGLMQLRQPRAVEADLREILHGLRLAEQRLVLEQDRTGALFLYRRALARLQALNPPGSLSAQAQLREELEQIQAFQPVVWAELALELQELAERIVEQPQLSLHTLTEQLTQSEAQSTSAIALAWYEILWQELRSLIVIRHHTTPVQPLEDAQQVALARQQLVSLLQQAAWAALHQEAELYRSSLTRAAQRLAQQEGAPWHDWSERVAHLAEQSFEPALPRTGQAIVALEAWLDAQPDAASTPVEASETAEEDINTSSEEAR